ncbi:RimK family alpha-L-glutamate ligase [Micromonospora sp. DT229]|uniref:RimK family alpha-L-glutamate ligase n=1 Tax=Micromonospora sp. DT229 TaxID=3393430 RepID=UPI003CF81776
MTVIDGPVALVASRVRVEEKRLMDALDRRAVRYQHVDPRTLWHRAEDGARWGLALNREIAHSRALAVARTLEAQGSTVFNSATTTEVCGDKWRSTLALRAAGLPVPRTALGLTPEAALDALDAIGYPAVIKPLQGSWGRLVSLVPDRQVAETLLEYVAALPAPQARLVYVQEFVDKPGRDIRVLVVGGRAIAATYRTGSGLRTNVARGAQSLPCPVTEDVAGLATAAAKAVGGDVTGVDLIETRAGDLLVLEVNDRVEFAGLQAALGDTVDVASHIVDLVVRG